MDFKDLFSIQSADYARFRPTYPEALFDHLALSCGERHLAWDCGTGSGQAARALASRFDRVIATDPSEKQLATAQPHPRIEYRVARAERSGLPDRCADLITVAQAFHWFRQAEFFTEAARVLKPGGVLAIWCYAVHEITPEIDAVIGRFYRGTLDSYWEPERRMVEDGYAGVRLPFPELEAPGLELRADWSLQHLIGYLSTWSALQKYIQVNRENPLEALAPELRLVWGHAPTRTVRWPLALRLARRP